MTNSNLRTKLKTKKAFIWLRMKISNKKHKDSKKKWQGMYFPQKREKRRKKKKRNDHL